ncbi:hypothetical protein PCE1_003699 [Barthelona sp. PCE]
MTSRTALTNWINDLFSVSYPDLMKVAESAAIYPLIIDACHQNVPVRLVDFGANTESSRRENLKRLQKAYLKNGIQNAIEIEPIAKGRFQANYLLLQFLYEYWTAHFDESIGYDGGERVRATKNFNRSPYGDGTVAVAPSPQKAKRSNGRVARTRRTEASPLRRNGKAAVDEQKEHVAKLQLDIVGMEKKVTFYKEKLQEIALLISQYPENEVSEQILNILEGNVAQ